ncbi:hypothetical protein BC938DRAFT_477578 [Jimgerdemannia flammicorona]|uniref:Uncharacterized protein n=1 Tax=Jimgerdemannia flammicorona TaxID=994334 RepID=A0A433P8Y4_9FUNG|nr:hypothetical protein BC938DRAFT_477578 [Jimgerdemannia flammicorona]
MLTNPIAFRTALLGAARNPSLLAVLVACARTWLGTIAACIAFYHQVMRSGDAKVAMIGPVEGMFKFFSRWKSERETRFVEIGREVNL